MINLKNIYNAPVITDPWEHKIVEDIFTPEAFAKISKAASHLMQYAVEGKTNPIWMHEAIELGVDEDVIETIITGADNILDNISKIMEPFSNKNKSNLGYYAMPKFGVSGTNFEYPIHTESNHKVLLFVIYLAPEEHDGTLLYTSIDPKDFAKEVPWKPNRAFVMCPRDNDVTWHNWNNHGKESRVTLNIFCEKLENLEESVLKSGKNDETKDLFWLYEKIGQNRLTSNKY